MKESTKAERTSQRKLAAWIQKRQGGIDMVIAHNMQAAFTQRQLNITNRGKSKIAERLGSGYRINRAADDAAGLAISEEMRGQIRGLNRAALNIEEGCSLIDTADGAMSQQADILQRMRELTIQAYNDTYTQDDRLDIQREIDALCEELDRIAKDTEYNTQKILLGPKEPTITITTEVIEPTEPTRIIWDEYQIKKEIPDWLLNNMDKNLTNDPNKPQHISSDSKAEQDVNDYVIINQDNADPTKGEFYGPEEKWEEIQIGQHKETLTKKLDDNYRAGMDFSELAGCTDKTKLLTRIMDLAGVAIAYECATCSDRGQGFYFYSDDVKLVSLQTLEKMKDDVDGVINGIQYGNIIPSDIQGIDLQPFLNKAGGLLDQKAYEALPEEDQKELTDSQSTDYKNYIKKTAEEITGDIVEAIVKKSPSDHFVRVTRDENKPYELIFYDFRDQNIVEEKLNGDALGKAFVTISIPREVKNKPYTIYHRHVEEHDFNIQAGANTMQKISFDLPDTTLASLGLEGYTIFKDGYCSAGKNGMYDAAAMVSAEDLGGNMYQGYVGGRVETKTKTVSGTRKYQIMDREMTYEGGTNGTGEYIPPKFKWVVKEEKEEAYSYTTTYVTTVGGRYTTFRAYKPDTLLRIDRAIDKLTDYRTQLGAIRNRLDHAYANDTNESENLQASESLIRDTDFAQEMAAFAKDSILQQAAQSLLAQANQSPSGILALLR